MRLPTTTAATAAAAAARPQIDWTAAAFLLSDVRRLKNDYDSRLLRCLVCFRWRLLISTGPFFLLLLPFLFLPLLLLLLATISICQRGEQTIASSVSQSVSAKCNRPAAAAATVLRQIETIGCCCCCWGEGKKQWGRLIIVAYYCYIARSIVVEVEFLLLLLLLMPTRPFLAAVSPIGASDWAPLSLCDLSFHICRKGWKYYCYLARN